MDIFFWQFSSSQTVTVITRGYMIQPDSFAKLFGTECLDVHPSEVVHDNDVTGNGKNTTCYRRITKNKFFLFLNYRNM